MALLRSHTTIDGMECIEGLPSRYRIESRLGKGGFGKVFRVFDSHLDIAVALKAISQDSARVRASLMKEFKILSKLQHPNLVRVYDFGHFSPDIFYFTMELIDGPGLRSYLKDGGSARTIPSILEQLLSALGYLHRNGVIHGDIKPDNIMIEIQSGSPRAKLLDFGLMASRTVSREMKIGGTARYLAPEILRSGEKKSPATDFYALGATLVESIEDRDFPAPTDLTEKLLKERYIGLSGSLGEGGVRNPSSLASFIIDLCRPDPLQRPASAEAALHTLETQVLPSYRDRESPPAHVHVGRKREIDEIAAFLRPEQASKKILVLRGPRGAGKKSIIRRAMQMGQLKRRLLIDLGSSSYDSFSINEVVQLMASQLGASEREVLLAKLPAISSSAKSLKSAADPGGLEKRSLVLYNHIIEGLREIASSRPLTLVVTDVDRLGRDYARFLIQIMNHFDLMDLGIKLLFSLNTDVSPSEAGPSIASMLAASPKASLIDIHGFTDEMLIDYLEGTYGECLLSEAERRALLEKTKGIPLIVEASLRRLMTTKTIRLEQGKWRFDRSSFALERIPLECGDAFSIEFGDLGPGERDLLHLLAILHHDISKDRLAELSGPLVPEYRPALAGLVSRAILSRGRGEIIAFAHPLYRECVLDTCPAERALVLNHAVADYLARTEPSEELRTAKHYIKAENIEKAMQYSFSAVNKLYSSYMIYDCLNLLRELKALVKANGTRGQLVEVDERLAPIEHQTGLLKDASDTYGELAEQEADPSRKAHYLIQLGIVVDSMGNADKAIPIMRKALQLCRKLHMDNCLATIYYHLGDISQKRTIYYLERALEYAKDTNFNLYLMIVARLCHRYKYAGNLAKADSLEGILLRELDRADAEAKKEIYRNLASIHLHKGDYESHRYYLEKKIEIEREEDDAPSLVRSLMASGGYHYAKAHYFSLISTLKDAYSLSIRYNQMPVAIGASFNLMLAYRVIADYGKSLAMGGEAERLLQNAESGQIGSIFYVTPAQLYALLGESCKNSFDSSVMRLRKSAERSGSAISMGHYHMCYSSYHHINLRHGEALSSAKKALELFEKAEDRDDVVLALVQMGLIQAALGSGDEAAASIREAVEIYEDIECEYLKPFLWLGRGAVARGMGSEDAPRLLAEGLRTSKKIGTREITWQIHREQALYRRDRDEFREAMESFQETIETLKQITETFDDEELKISYLEVPARRRVFDEIKDLKRRIRQSAQ